MQFVRDSECASVARLLREFHRANTARECLGDSFERDEKTRDSRASPRRISEVRLLKFELENLLLSGKCILDPAERLVALCRLFPWT